MMRHLKKIIPLSMGLSLFASPLGADNTVSAASTDTNADIMQLQRKLSLLGYFNTTPTGYNGEITRNAVSNFQRDFGLGIDGVAGPLTLQKLEDVEKIAHVVYGEARGESFEGQVAVAAVVINRVHSPEFPSSVASVITQQNAFTAVSDGQYYLSPNATAYKAVKAAYKGWDPSYGATYYYNPVDSTNTWIFSRKVIRTIGKHNFAY
jgi:N-acetylmuramoyl-L-alanine amidase